MSDLRSINEVPGVDFQISDLVDPYPVLKSLRETTPLVRTPMGIIVALRHRHLSIVTQDTTRQLETETKLIQGISSGPIYDFINNVMLFSNGAAHKRRRSPVARTFAFKLMESMRARAASLTEELVREHLGQGPFDFVDEIAAQIPARIIAEILGIPRSDLPVFLQWIKTTGEAVGLVDPSRRALIEESMTAFGAYVDDLLADRRATPRGDFLSDYVEATAKDGDMSEAEVRAQVIILILGGSDTTRGSISMTLARLLDHPDQWAAFCADPDGLKKAVVDEGLRYEPVIVTVPRLTLQEIELDGYAIPQGTVVAISLVSALRDLDIYADPDTFNIHRTDHPRWHPVFGAGAHRCLGEALARVEIEESLAVIARLAPKAKLIGASPRLSPGVLRQIDQMTVDLG
jgi:cytochrome P450